MKERNTILIKNARMLLDLAEADDDASLSMNLVLRTKKCTFTMDAQGLTSLMTTSSSAIDMRSMFEALQTIEVGDE